MVRKAFSGDLIYELPKGKVEPYRLWFEYLKFAIETIPSRVDRRLYEPWGDILNSDFDEWFQKSWRNLFANQASVSLVNNIDDAQEALRDTGSILIKVRNTAPIRRQITDLTKALKVFSGTKKISQDNDPLFIIDSKRSMSLDTLRSMLKFLRLMQIHQDIELAALEYYNWADAWNKKIKVKKNDKRSPIHIPAPIGGLIRQIESHEREKNGSKRKIKKSVAYNNARSDVRRFQRKAETVVFNVARGQFPGEY